MATRADEVLCLPAVAGGVRCPAIATLANIRLLGECVCLFDPELGVPRLPSDQPSCVPAARQDGLRWHRHPDWCVDAPVSCSTARALTCVRLPPAGSAVPVMYYGFCNVFLRWFYITALSAVCGACIVVSLMDTFRCALALGGPVAATLRSISHGCLVCLWLCACVGTACVQPTKVSNSENVAVCRSWNDGWLSNGTHGGCD